MSPYQPLEVLDAYNKVVGARWFVRDAEESYFWPVEYVGRRLTCRCDDGEAHAESPDTEAPCAHLTAVVDDRMARSRAAGPPLGVLIPSAFVD